MLKLNRSQTKKFVLKDIILVPYRDFYIVLNSSEILYIKADKAYSKITLLNGKEYLVSKNIKLIQNILPVNFIRTHNSYLINVLHAVSFHKNSTFILNNNEVIPLSRRRKKHVLELVNEM
jgi:two-component system, LytTR family, response regulator